MRIEVNEILARMLAIENLHIRYSPSAKTAHFDVKRRLLTLPLYARLKEIVYLLLAGHEAFHALWTKMDRVEAANLIDPKNQRRAAGYVNICEDVRIENLGKEQYPGMAKVFREGYGVLVADKFFGDLSKIHQKSLIDRVNIHFKAGAHVHVPFAEQELPYVQAIGKARTFDEMIAACRAIYYFARDTQNEQFPDLDQDQPENEDQDQDQQKSKSKSKSKKSKDQDSSKEDKQKDKGKEKQKKQEQDGDDDDEDSDSGESEEDEQSGEEQDADESGDESDSDENGDESGDDDGVDADPGDEDSDGESGKTGDEGDDDAESGDESEDGGDEGNDGAESGDDDNEDDTEATGSPDSTSPHNQRPLDATSQDEFDHNLQGHCEPTQDFHYVTLPHVNLKAAVVDYTQVMKELTAACIADGEDPITGKTKRGYVAKKEWFDQLQRKLEPDVMFMLQQFMMHRRADQYSRTRTSTTGDLDMNRLWAHKISDTIFATTEQVPNDKNHGMIMVVDWSGSMKTPLFDVMVQLMSLMMFCRKANIPFEVYIFITRHSAVGNTFIGSTDSASVAVAGETRLYNIFSSRMPQMHFYQMGLMLFSSFSGSVFKPPLSWLDPDCYGTPLGEAMLIASAVVPEFQKKYRLQFVHTIFLTDGDGNSQMTCRAHQLEDPITRRTYSPETGKNEIEVLHLLPRIVRDRTRAKMIGFYVGDPTTRMLQDSNMNSADARKILAKEGFFTVSGTNYDAFYVLNPKMIVPDKIDPSEVITARMKSRVMLQRFIKMIA